MKSSTFVISLLTTVFLLIIGAIIVVPVVFAGRALPTSKLSGNSVAGLKHDDISLTLKQQESDILSQTINFSLKGNTITHTLREIGASLDYEKTIGLVQGMSIKNLFLNQSNVTPQIKFDDKQLAMQLERSFAAEIIPPENASLNFLGAEGLTLVPSRRGETVYTSHLKDTIISTLRSASNNPINLVIVEAEPEIANDEVDQAKAYAEIILADGITLNFNEEIFTIKPSTVRRLITFVEQVDTKDHSNHILGVKLETAGLTDYLKQTIEPQVNQEAQNARFELNSDLTGTNKVEQFSLPQDGQTLDIARTSSHIASRLAVYQSNVPLAVDVTTPEVSRSTDLERLGITSLLSTGTSDFDGSTNNRVHNITVGTSRYHGLLIPPDAEFSFNEFLGPVDGVHGFKKELVIKSDVTIPEYGGGLCQVSTTIFRAALNAGLEITDRRNHAYAVSYYGDPGLDATIYPPYTDLRFHNNTPNYILIQSRIIGSKLDFEFWGTDDGRKVVLDGPSSYDRRPDGAVKATVQQQVTRDGEVIIDETFYSRYKSPNLFPKVLSASDKPPI